MKYEKTVRLKKLVVWSIISFLVLMSGCASRTFTGQQRGSPFEMSERLIVRIAGEYGRGFDEAGPKKVSVGVLRNGAQASDDTWLGRYELIVNGAGLDQVILWLDKDSVDVEFFDYGAYSKYDPKVTSGEVKRGPTLMRVRLIRADGRGDFKLDDCAKVAC
jgi:hypothetical protein